MASADAVETLDVDEDRRRGGVGVVGQERYVEAWSIIDKHERFQST